MRAWKPGEEPPVRGCWKREDAHFPFSMSPHLWDLFVPAYRAGTAEGLARYGSIISHFDMSRFSGRTYVRPRFIWDSPGSRSETIAADFLATHPRAVARARAAEASLREKIWRSDREKWESTRDAARRQLLKLGRVDHSRIGPVEVCRQLGVLRKIFVDGTTQHFVRQPASMLPVGDWLRKTSGWTGAPPTELVVLLQGSSPGSAGCLEAIDAIVEVIASVPSAGRILHDYRTSPGVRLRRLCQCSPVVGELLESYIDEYGDRIVTGFDLTDLTLRETPGAMLAAFSSRLAARSGEADARWRARTRRRDRAAILIRARVPRSHRMEFDDGLEEARLAYGLHDEDMGTSYLWPLGLLRRTMIEVASRLLRERRIERLADVFQTTPEEFDRLIHGHEAPTDRELARRSESFLASRGRTSPASIGVEETLAEELLTDACSTVHHAITYYMDQMEGRAGRAGRADSSSHRAPIRGIAASPGLYEGLSRVIVDPQDIGSLSLGDVLVAHTLSPAYNLLMPVVGAVVTDRGGTLCHAAIVAREMGVPAVVGTRHATVNIRNRVRVRVDGTQGIVEIQ